MENTSFGSFSAGLHHKNLPAAAGGILISGGLAAIIAGLEPAGLRYLALFAGKGAGYSLTHYVHPLLQNMTS
jgi:hypothetical protein